MAGPRRWRSASGSAAHLKDAVAIAKGLVRTMLANDADLVEINPLAIVREAGADGADVERLVCLDAKITLDDSALARHPGLEDLRDPDDEDPTDRAAREAGLTFIKLDGTIGCMVNGAGLAMATMDLVKRAGGEPANFLDIGGGARADKVAAAMRLILADPKVDAILVNIFGGITRGDEVARGLIEARKPAGAGRADGRPDRRARTRPRPRCSSARPGSTPRTRSTRRPPRPWPRRRERRREHPRRPVQPGRRPRPDRPRGLVPRRRDARLRDAGRRRG